MSLLIRLVHATHYLENWRRSTIYTVIYHCPDHSRHSNLIIVIQLWLGNDKVDYMSNTHRALSNIDTQSANDVAKNLEHAKEMKAALQRTSISIGDDKDYY